MRVNDIDLWTIQTYAATPANGQDRWGTWWGQIAPYTVGDVTATEGAAGLASALFTIRLLITNSPVAILNFATADGTALAGEDYVATNGTLVFSPGETHKVLAVSILGDTVSETDETVFLQVRDPTTTSLLVQARLTIVNDDLFITQQPRNQTVRLGLNASFSVSVTSANPVTYQWRFNGTNIDGATNATSVLTNVQLANEGLYNVLVEDTTTSVVSSNATLTVLVPPQLIHPSSPLLVSAVAGEDLTFSVLTRGTLPMNYRWRRGSTTLTNQFQQGHSAFFTLRNLASGNAFVTVHITNVANAGSSSSLYTNAILTVLADNDGDRLPDAWEAVHGFSTNDLSDAGLDADGDTLSNHEEYIAGTDPRDAESYLKVERIEAVGSAKLWFTAVSNRTYTVEFKDALSEAVWSKLTDVVAQPVTHLESVVDSNFTTNRYYRLATPRR